MADTDLLSISGGAVTAPAGCGKTHLIAESLKHYSGKKPVLVLTHTNAGVAALRDRLGKADVPPRAYRLSTIDGWAMRLISTFPERSGHDPGILDLRNPRSDYEAIRMAATGLLKAGHVNDIIGATYERLIVDEYQDCSVSQHSLVSHAAQVLPTCVLGDPMQAIFGFGRERLAHWEQEVCTQFPVVLELSTPWRWIKYSAEPLGEWLLEVRGKLIRGESIDLREAPAAVRWYHLDGRNDHKTRLNAARVKPPGDKGTVFVIGDSANPRSHRKLASQLPGAATVEAVELGDLVALSDSLVVKSPTALEHLARFAQLTMTNVRAGNLLQRVESLARGRARKPASSVERSALAFMESPSYSAAARLLLEISQGAGVRVYRPTLLRACMRALQLSDQLGEVSFADAVIRVREEYRFMGRRLPKRAVGSTLLLKGLEANVAVVLNAADLDARNLYVAMTRGSQALVVCSPTQLLLP